MSTQAPAGAASQPAVAGSTTPEAPKAEIKPIRTKGLPGLVDHKDDPQDAALARHKAAKAARAAEGSEHLNPAIMDAPERSEVPGAAAEKATQPQAATEKGAEAPTDPAKPAPDAATSPEATERLAYLNKLLGEKFDSIDKAEHSLKTVKGMHKAYIKRAEEAEKKAEGWYREAQRLANQPPAQSDSRVPTQPEAGRPAAGKQPASSDPVAALFEAVDPKTYREVRERSGDETAFYWALTKLQARFDAQLKEALESRLKPYEEQSKQSAEIRRVHDTFKAAMEMTDDSGDPVYPEFADPAFLEAAVKIWHEMSMSEAVAYSPKGVHAAYGVAKDHFSRFGIKLANSAPTRATPTPATPEAVEKVAAAVAEGLTGRGNSNPGVLGATGAHPLRPTNGTVSEADAIRRRILAADPVHPKLGFAVTAR